MKKNTRYHQRKRRREERSRKLTNEGNRLERRAEKILKAHGIEFNDSDDYPLDNPLLDRHKCVRMAVTAMEHDESIRPMLDAYLERRGLQFLAQTFHATDRFICETRANVTANMNASFHSPYVIEGVVPNVYLIHKVGYQCNVRVSRELLLDWEKKFENKGWDVGKVNVRKDGLHTFKIAGKGLVPEVLKAELKRLGFAIKGKATFCRYLEVKFYTACQPDFDVLNAMAERLNLNHVWSDRPEMDEHVREGNGLTLTWYRLSDNQADKERCPRYGWCVEMRAEGLKLYGSKTFKKKVSDVIEDLDVIREEAKANPLHLIGNTHRRGQAPAGRVVVPNNWLCLHRRDRIGSALCNGVFTTWDAIMEAGFEDVAECNRFLERWRDNKGEGLVEVERGDHRGRDRMWQVSEPVPSRGAPTESDAMNSAVAFVEMSFSSCEHLELSHRLPFFSLVPI